ncbi:MAG: hypothetical protein ACREAM_24160 [Blastocatellia bacterium]
MKRTNNSDRRSLWSAGAWYRFGSHLRFYRLTGQRTQWASFQSLPQHRSGLPKRYQAPALQRLRRSDLRETVVFYMTIVVGLCLIFSSPAAAQQKSETDFTTAQLEELLDKATALKDKYHALFRDLTAEEKRVFEFYDKKTGQVKNRHQTVSDLIVYASQKDPKRVTEYRNIREVDGKPVKNQFERVEKLFERVAKADSPDKEIDRVIRESSRYDFGARVIGYTIVNAIATWKPLRRFFKYEFAGRERVGEQELVVIKFEQTEVVENLGGLEEYQKLNVTGPLMRGQYWLDPQTGQLRREHHEIFFRDNAQPRTFKAIEADFDFTSGEQGIWLSKRILFQSFNPLKSDKGFPVEMFLNVRITSEFGPFRRFEVKARHENVP